jgi:membrane-bound ClpP family serine protease
VLIPIALIILGVLLIMAEVYLIPGLNVVGILGAFLMLAAVILAFMEAGAIGGVIAMTSAIALTGGSLWWLWRSGAWDRFVLSSSLRTDERLLAREGEARSRYLGRQGVALTPLRPTGVAEIEGERIEVVTEGDFISAGSRVKVVAMDRRKYFVRLDSDTKATA